MNSKRKSVNKCGNNKNLTKDIKNKKLRKYSEVNLHPALDDRMKDFRKCWEQKKIFSNSNSGCKIELYDSPFQLCVIRNLLKDSDPFLEDLKDELSDLNYSTKNNDLYQFHQSQDLAEVDSSAVGAIRELLYNNLMTWVKEVTGLPLNNKVDVTCSRYDHTDVLLCHDDQTETRKIAFIYYLTRKWHESDGGTLDMFDRDGNDQPKSVNKSIVPEWNSLAFFEVTDKSFHQVSEVITEDKTRVALSGWFHVDVPLAISPYMEPAPSCINPIISEVDLSQWIEISYLMEDTHHEINKFFEDNSEIRLKKFFVSDKFTEVSEALSNPAITWSSRGPANRRNYEVASLNPEPACVWELLELLQSQQMFELLAAMTDLDLSDMDTDHEGRARCHAELQRWSPGCYTLAHDTVETKNTLELLVHFQCEDLSHDAGGFTSFIAKDDDDELLTVQPAANSLALTYKDKDTLTFVKYINQRCKHPFYAISVTYYERPTPSS